MNIRRRKVTEISDDFLRMSWKDQHIFGFWYRKPQNIDSYDLLDVLDGKDPFSLWCKKHHPVQYWFRDTLYWKVAGLYYRTVEKIRSICKSIFSPYNTRIRKSIPTGTWTDISYLIPEMVFAAVIQFDEEIEKYNFVNWQATPEHSKFMKEFKECVKWAHSRKETREEIDAPGLDYKTRIERETNYNNTERKWLQWVAQNYPFMWT